MADWPNMTHEEKGDLLTRLAAAHRGRITASALCAAVSSALGSRVTRNTIIGFLSRNPDAAPKVILEGVKPAAKPRSRPRVVPDPRLPWWKRASDADKLKQIDAARELGMTERQCAMNLRLPLPASPQDHTAVYYFAMKHGRRFRGTVSRASKVTPPVPRRYTPSPPSGDAYDIFQHGVTSVNLFSKHPYDEGEFG